MGRQVRHHENVMIQKISDGLFLIGGEEPEGPCAFCGKDEELRPFGPNDELICFDCAMKDEKTTNRKFNEQIDGKAN